MALVAAIRTDSIRSLFSAFSASKIFASSIPTSPRDILYQNGFQEIPLKIWHIYIYIYIPEISLFPNRNITTIFSIVCATIDLTLWSADLIICGLIKYSIHLATFIYSSESFLWAASANTSTASSASKISPIKRTAPF